MLSTTIRNHIDIQTYGQTYSTFSAPPVVLYFLIPCPGPNFPSSNFSAHGLTTLNLGRLISFVEQIVWFP